MEKKIKARTILVKVSHCMVGSLDNPPTKDMTCQAPTRLELPTRVRLMPSQVFKEQLLLLECHRLLVELESPMRIPGCVAQHLNSITHTFWKMDRKIRV